VIAVFDSANLQAQELPAAAEPNDVAGQFRRMIVQGNRAYAEASAELEALIAAESDTSRGR